jgi:carotenoid cleavage dioxygenase
MYRWRVHLKTGATREEALDEVPSEFPQINEGLIGGQIRYGYTAGFVDGDHSPSRLIKYDYKQGSAEHHVHGQGRLGREGVFVSRPHARAEDDG